MILSRRGRRLIDRLADPPDEILSLLLDDPNTGVLFVDRSGRILRANAHVTRILGRPLEDTRLETLFHNDKWLLLQTAMAAGLRGDRMTAPVRTHLATKTELAVAVSVSPVREADASITGLVFRITDIDAELQLEAHLAHSQKLQAVGLLAGGIAHDFNNLLTVIIGGVDGMLAHRGNDTESVDDLRQVRLAAERGAALVRQLLAFGRRQPLQPRVIPANLAVKDLAGLLQRLLSEKIHLDLVLEEPGRLIRVDPTQLDQMLINLAVNARGAMPEGGTLTLRTGHRTLYRPETHEAETIAAGRYVLIEVEDTGTGIPPELMPRIFEPFFTTKRDSGGSGLGLSTVLGIIRQSDGFLTLDSTVGKGTIVRLYLPRYEGDRKSDGLPPPIPYVDPPACPGHLLLVEDDDAVRRFAERGLRRAGWTVTAADSGETALMSLPVEPGSLDLVISDVVMTGMEGPALLLELRKIWPDLPAVLVSGYAESVLKGDFPTNRTIFLPKPYSLAELLGAAEAVRK